MVRTEPETMPWVSIVCRITAAKMDIKIKLPQKTKRAGENTPQKRTFPNKEVIR